MIFKQTLLKICDNSGGVLALCIKILGNSKKVGLVGDAVIVSIKKVTSVKRKIKKKILKGTVRKAVIVRSSKKIKR